MVVFALSFCNGINRASAKFEVDRMYRALRRCKHTGRKMFGKIVPLE